MPIRLIHLTDPHLFGDEHGALRGIETLASLQRALAHARAHEAPPDAWLVTGDLVQDDAGGYAHFRRCFAGLDRPVLCLPGNHDDPAALHQALAGEPFRVGGFADLGAWRIVLLDSVVPGAARGRIEAAELQRLDATLAGAPRRHALVCLHHHPVSMASRWLDQVGLENHLEFLAVTERHRQVRAILWGHVHQSFEALRKGAAAVHALHLRAVPAALGRFRDRRAPSSCVSHARAA